MQANHEAFLQDRRNHLVNRHAEIMKRVNRQDMLQAHRQYKLAMADRIDLALRKIDRMPEAYGRCEHCGQEIAVARLQKMPESQYCVRCQTAVAEKRQVV